MAPRSFPTQLILAVCILELMGARLGVNSTFLMKLEPEIGSTKVQYRSLHHLRFWLVAEDGPFAGVESTPYTRNTSNNRNKTQQHFSSHPAQNTSHKDASPALRLAYKWAAHRWCKSDPNPFFSKHPSHAAQKCSVLSWSYPERSS